MRGHTNGLILHFINILALLNALLLVAGQSVTVGLGHGGTATEVFTKNPPHNSPSQTPIPTPTGDSNASDSQPITASASTPISSSTGAALGSSASTRKNLPPGVIAGIVVAAVIPLALVLGIFLLYRRKRRRQPLRRGAVNLTVGLEPIGSPIYEKDFVPTPFLTDTEANGLGYDQVTRRIGAKFTTADGLDSAPPHPRLSVLSTSQTHTSLPVLLSNSGHSMEPPADSRSTLAIERPSTASSEDTLTEEAPPPHNLAQFGRPYDVGYHSDDLIEEVVAQAI